MRRFTAVCRRLDELVQVTAKAAALARYFHESPSHDAECALRLLAGPRPRRQVSARQLRQWAGEAAAAPPWLVAECAATVGNVAETAALLLADAPPVDWPLHRLVAERLEPLAGAPPSRRRELVLATWRELPADQRLVWNELVSGTFRSRAPRELILQAFAVARPSGPDASVHQPAAGDDRDPTERWGLEDPGLAGRPWPSGAPGAQGAPRAAIALTAVLVYAERGDSGRGAFYEDLTFAVWSERELVPVARVPAALDGAERIELDRWVRRNAIERFGPVRRVRPELVFELDCSAVRASRRHKSGLVVESPRVRGWCRAAPPEQADTLARLRRLLGS